MAKYLIQALTRRLQNVEVKKYLSAQVEALTNGLLGTLLNFSGEDGVLFIVVDKDVTY